MLCPLCSARPRHQLIEGGHVDAHRRVESVPAVGAHDALALGPEGSPEAVDESLQAGRPVARDVVAPQVVDEPLARDGLPGVQGETGQQGTLEGSCERDVVTVGVDLDRTEQSDGDHRALP